MDRLPIQLALVEVIRTLLFCTRSEDIQMTPLHLGIELKSKKKACQGSQKIFYIRVSSNSDVSFQALLKDGYLPTFIKMVLAMQCHEEEAHLSVQQSDATNVNLITQKIIWLSQEGDKINVDCRQTSTVTNLDSMECDNFVIHFRVVQPEEYILLEGQQFCKFLYWLKFLNPLISITFTMKISGAVCNTDFSYKTTTAFQNLTLINDPVYLLWHSKSKAAGKVFCCSGNSVSMEYVDKFTGSTSSLCISSIICFLPIWKEPSQHSSWTGKFLITVYGPQYVPLQLHSASVEDFHSLINWNRFAFVVNKVQPCLKDCLQWEIRMDAEIADQLILPKTPSTNSFLLHISIIISSKNACSSKYDAQLHTRLSADETLLSWHALKESVESSFQTFCHLKNGEENPKKIALLTKTIPLISKALCDVVSLSCNAEFRLEMQCVTQTDCLDAMRKDLTNRLWKLSNCQEPVHCNSQQNYALIGPEEDDIPVIDSWEELTSCSPSQQADQLEGQSSFIEETNQEPMRPSAEQEIGSAMPLPEETEIHQFPLDQSFFDDLEIDFSSITDINEVDPSSEVVNNNMEPEESSLEIIENDNNTTTNQTDSAWYNEVMLDVADWI
ncbi:uncharacterized protein LOC121371126 [Gigantopelta aegis]|uniref:uncharacterized protein LOC121371126 n=1 Tax=Gigantopelta aegis TaxID=1735272 RepID=UPI001B88A105|nr:uncharacterized protein LOC121371126 [Gigantopelta aegis]